MFKPYLWSKHKIGVLIIHGGVILLLIGSGLTAYFSTEGSMVIDEGNSSNYVVDFHLKELAIINTNYKEYDQITAISNNQLFKNNIINHKNIPFQIEIIEYYKNCRAQKLIVPISNKYKGLAHTFALIQADDEKEDNHNQAGITFKLSGISESMDGIYSLLLGQPIPQTIQVGGNDMTLVLRRQRTHLPFEIELIDFKKVLHPGTGIAKSFSSNINLIEDGKSRKVLIKMNEPLRHKGYTFYQSSYRQDQGRETTILSAVKNYGRLFPYISSLIISLGLLLHMLGKLPRLLKSKVAKET
jgi:cytochrome c biogenesis protein ResB